MSNRPTFYGKYAGIVDDNEDPTLRGRIRAKVRDVYGDQVSGWAMPCVPYAGKNVGIYMLPPKGAFVWIEFEYGDPDYPIWSGCLWGSGELPVTPAIPPDKKVIKTDVGSITLDDSPGAGGITIETTAGMKIVIDTQGIEINNGQGASIKLSGTQVSINDGALEVT